MAKIWYGKNSRNVGSSTVTIRQVKFQSQRAITQRVCSVVAAARAWIKITLPEMTTTPSGPVYGDFLACFIKASNAGMMTAKARLSAVSTELNKDLSIKVRALGGDSGYASAYFSGKTKRVGGTVFYDEDGDEIKPYGDIHLDSVDLMTRPVYAAITLIHEATHKFANTDDFDNKGYFKDDGSDFRAPGLTWQQALKNADSYAFFVYKVMQGKYHQLIVT